MKDTTIKQQLNMEDKLASALSKVTASRELLDLVEGSIRELLDIIASGEDIISVPKHDQVSPTREHILLHEDGERNPTELVSKSSGRMLPDKAAPSNEINRNGDSEATTSVMRGGISWSPRELQVLAGIAAGLSNDQISAALSIQPTYARRIRQRLYSKLDVHNIDDAIARAEELGLLDSLPEIVQPALPPNDITGEDEHIMSESVHALQPEETAVPSPEQSAKQPERVVMLMNPMDGSFTVNAAAGKNGLVCFVKREAASMFAKYNQPASGCIPIEMNVEIAQQLARSQDKTVCCLMLMDDPQSPVILDLEQ